MDTQPLAAIEAFNTSVEAHNQRLEFLGDAVLEMLTTHHLFCLVPYADEGALTDYRTGLVSNKVLAHNAARLGFHAFLLIGELSPKRTRWADEPNAYEKLLSDVFESFLGALYLDRGLEACTHLFAQVVFFGRADLPLRRCWLRATTDPYEPPVAEDREPPPTADPTHAACLQFERMTGLRFRWFGLLRQAFTHPSFYSYHSDRDREGGVQRAAGRATYHDNQRLEFLGDAVLQLVSTEYLFRHFPEHQEGQLTMMRSSLVSNAVLCDVAVTTGMHECVRFTHGGMDVVGRARRGMLSDCFEAFVGALYLDRQPRGLAHVQAFVRTMIFSLTKRMVAERQWMDPKMRLQLCLNEFNQTSAVPLSKRFQLLDEWGPSHERMYLVGCYINGALVAQARGQSLADGQMGAAQAALAALLDEDSTATTPKPSSPPAPSRATE